MKLIRLPWMTLTIVALTVVIYCVPTFSSALIYDRSLVLEGQWWRVATSLLVHYSASHLFWNLLALVVFGTLLEEGQRAAFLWLILLSVAGNSLLVFNPDIGLYAGISGLVVALAGYCCVINIVRAEALKPWSFLMVILLAKVGYESLSGSILFAGGDFRVLPQVHLIGLVCAIFLFFFFGNRRNSVACEEQGS